MKTKVNKNNAVEYEEEAKDFTGLIFHCPECEKEFHLHISEVIIKRFRKEKGK